LNTGKGKSISFSHGSKPVMFQYVIGDSELERVAVINDLGVLVDSKMTFVHHIESNFKGVHRPLKAQDVICPAGFRVCIVRVISSSRGPWTF
jgi:hypothetical protein